MDGTEVASGAFAGPMQYDDNPAVIGADNDNVEFRPLGVIGVLTTASAQDITCSDWDTVDTGP